MKRTAMVGLLALVSWSAQAAHDVPGWRAGVAASFTNFKWTDGDVEVINDSSIGGKVYAQYEFNDWFAVEGAYHNSSSLSGDLVNVPTGSTIPAGNYKIQFSGFSGALLGYLPIRSDNIRIYGKVGYYDFNDDLTRDGDVTTNGSESGLMAGGGVAIEITDRFGIRVDGDWFDADVGDLWAVNLGLEYFFGGTKKVEPVAAPPPPPPPEPVVAPPPPPPPPADSDGDGVTDDKDACPGTPAGAKVNAQGCEEQLTLRGVTFENNSAKLTPNSTLTLDSVADILKQRPNFVVEVRGHTDNTGPDEHNMKLSQKRADAVMEYLISRGVPADKLTATGYGETQPIASNDTADGREQNRRVTLEFRQNR
jgi:outer membrane protein OmpA-like peptidoglycan-associated protein